MEDRYPRNHEEDFASLDMLMMNRESSPETDCLSVISDYSEMGYQIKKSIQYNDLVISTYSDLKDPQKAIRKASQTETDSFNVFRKYNILNLALEFSRWNEDNETNKCPNADSTLGDSLSDHIDCHSSDLSTNITTTSNTNYISSYPDNFESISPLKMHVNQKLENCFTFNRSNQSSDELLDTQMNVNDSGATTAASSNLDEGSVDRLEITKMKGKNNKLMEKKQFSNKWLSKMPISIRNLANTIHKFDISNYKYLNMLNIDQLQIMFNCFFTQIEEFNELLVMNLIIRDELTSEQQELMNQVEKLTIATQSLAKEIINSNNTSKINGKYFIHQKNSSATNSSVFKFFSTILSSPKYATGKFLSIFTSTSQTLPTPEFV